MANQEIFPSGGGSSIDDVASGQRLIILAILVNIGTLALRAAIGDIGGILGVVAIVLAILGLLRLGSGLGYSIGIRVLLIVLAIVPLVNLLMLFLVNSRANRELRAAGYKVGFFGARR